MFAHRLLRKWLTANRDKSYFCLKGPWRVSFNPLEALVSYHFKLPNLGNRNRYLMELVSVSSFWLAWQLPHSLASLGFLWQAVLLIVKGCQYKHCPLEPLQVTTERHRPRPASIGLCIPGPRTETLHREDRSCRQALG